MISLSRYPCFIRWIKELKLTSALAFPIILTQLGQIGVGTTDVLMIGRLGSQSLAALSLSFTLYFTLWVACFGSLQAVAPLIAQAVGAEDFRGIRRTVRQGLWYAILLSLPCMVVLWNSKTLLLFLGQQEGTAELSQQYLRAALWGLLPSFGFVVLRNYLAALSRPGITLKITLFLLLFNAGGNHLLIFGAFGFPRLELVGAGIISAAGQWISFLMILFYILVHRRFRSDRIFSRFWQPDRERFRLLFKIGLPIAGTMLAKSSLFSFAALMMGWLGTTELAAHAIAIQISAIAFMLPLGLGQAATIRVGYSVGRQDRAGIAVTGSAVLTLGMCLMLVTASILWIFPEDLARLFLSVKTPQDQATFELAFSLIVIAGFFQLAETLQVAAMHLLRGMNDTRTPMFFCWFAYWGIGLPSALFLGFTLDYGAVGIWSGLVTGLSTVAIWGLIRFFRRETLDLVPVS